MTSAHKFSFLLPNIFINAVVRQVLIDATNLGNFFRRDKHGNKRAFCEGNTFTSIFVEFNFYNESN